MLIDLPDDVVTEIEQGRDTYISIIRALKGRVEPELIFQKGWGDYDVTPTSYLGVSTDLLKKVKQILNLPTWSKAYMSTIEMRNISPDLRGWMLNDGYVGEDIIAQDTLVARPMRNTMKVHTVTATSKGVVDVETGKILRLKTRCYFVYNGDLRL